MRLFLTIIPLLLNIRPLDLIKVSASIYPTEYEESNKTKIQIDGSTLFVKDNYLIIIIMLIGLCITTNILLWSLMKENPIPRENDKLINEKIREYFNEYD